jgi:N-formylglutamate amidohydrolase
MLMCSRPPEDGDRPGFSIVDAASPLVTTAIHAGHDLRPEVAELVDLDDATRRREEDPLTDRLVVAGTRVVAHRSRFEVDLNRPRDRAVYRSPDDSWGLPVWKRPLPAPVIERSRALHDRFYAAMAERFDRLAERGPFVVFDVHSYNHRREGVPAPAEDNPELNVGTDGLDRDRWAPIVDGFVDEMRAHHVDGHPLDVRENVRFCGGHLSEWVHERYPDSGCVLALEFKKTFMDEWTGHPDGAHLTDLARALTDAALHLVDLVTKEAA